MIEELVGRLNAKKAEHKKSGAEIRALKKTIEMLEQEKQGVDLGAPEAPEQGLQEKRAPEPLSPEEKLHAKLKADGYQLDPNAENTQTEKTMTGKAPQENPGVAAAKAKAAAKLKKIKAKVDLTGAEEIPLAGATLSYLHEDGSRWIPLPEDGYAELGPNWIIQVFYGGTIKMIDDVPALRVLENRGETLMVKAYQQIGV